MLKRFALGIVVFALTMGVPVAEAFATASWTVIGRLARVVVHALASTPPPIHQQASFTYWTSPEGDQ